MENYNYGQNHELRHHGVKGMKWGVRRYRNKLARLTGKNRSEITEKQASNFRRDVKATKKGKGDGVSIRVDLSTGRITSYRDSKNRKIGEEYYNAVLKQAHRETTVRQLAGTATVAAGLAAVQGMLRMQSRST